MNAFAKSSVNHFVSQAEKEKEAWYISTYNTLLAISNNEFASQFTKITNALYGTLNKKDYSQYLNPFDFKEERHQNIPGRVRNYDIMLSNIRRFISEYVCSYQEFHVISSLPDEDNEMLDAANKLAYELLSKKALNQIKAMEEGSEPKDDGIDVQSQVDDFKTRWKDNRVINDYNMLEYLRSNSNDAYLYANAYFHWLCYGCYFIDRRIENNDVVKFLIDPLKARVIGSQDFIEDYDGFYYEREMTMAEIFAHHKEDLDDTQKTYLRNVEKVIKGNANVDDSRIKWGLYKQLIVEGGDGNINNEAAPLANDFNSITVGTLYYKGFKEIQILKHKDILGNEFEEEVDADYELNPLIGDISLTKEWYPVTIVQHRIGSKYKGVYTKPKEIEVQRQMLNNNALVKLPVTGKIGLFPGFPNHSIPNILYPFQVTVNLLHLVRERAVVTSQGQIGIIPKELLGSNANDQESEMYNMMVMKKLFITTENIPNLATVINSIKSINLSDYEFIKMIDSLIASTIDLANTSIDMNRQRMGNSLASDGKGTTKEAINRAAMGSAIINIIFDHSRCKDYQADIDFSKVAWVDGKKGKFVTTDRQRAFIDINGLTHTETEYGVFVKNSVEYDEQKQQILDYAFNLGQGGNVDSDVILDIITNKNISKLKEILKLAESLRKKRDDNRFQKEQETSKYNSDLAAQTAQSAQEFEKWKIETECLNDLLIKQVELTLKEMDMQQEDKNNEVLSNLEERKQALQTQINVLHNRG